MNENVKTALRALDSNRLRSVLTISIIAVGIMSIVGIETAVEILAERVAGSFEKMGAGMFTVREKESSPDITLRQAQKFRREAMGWASAISLYRYEEAMAVASSEGKSTDPVVSVIAADPDYLTCQAGAVASGRNLTSSDLERKSGVAVIGDNVRKKLFGPSDEGVGKFITVGDGRYCVVGTVRRQGAIFGTGLDNSVIVPILNGGGVSIDFIPAEGIELMAAAEMSVSLFRSIRRLGPASRLDFEIIKCNTAEDNLAAVKKKLSLAALAIGIITLLGAAVGLMNIMLVSVKQRTREIGIRKAVGAHPSEISSQFLVEAVVIGQAGGAVGIVLGILFGNLTALIMDGDFTVPWNWVCIAVVLCIAVSILSGLIPARKAAALDPILALYNE